MTFSEISMKDLVRQPHFCLLHNLTLSLRSISAPGKKIKTNLSNCFLCCRFSTSKLIVCGCCLNLICCRDLRACQKTDGGHCELCEPKGTLINSGFRCRESNLKDILIQLHVLLVHLCMKFIVLQQPSFQCQGPEPIRLLHCFSVYR